MFPGSALLRALEYVARKPFIKKAPIKGHVIMARSDGLFARINAIFNCLIISRYYNIPFVFTWRTDRGASNCIHSCIKSDAQLFIDQQFWDKYHVELERITESALPWHKNYLQFGREKSQLKVFNRLTNREELDKILKVQVNITCGDLVHLQSSDPSCSYKSISEEFFADTIKDQFKAIRQDRDWSKHIAMHYRAGDVVYGDIRQGWFVRYRSLTLATAEQLIQKHLDDPIILFGTPVGESLSELRFLEKKYPNIELSPEIKHASSEHNSISTIYDSYLMSLCKKLYAAKESNVANFAHRLNHVEICIPSDQYEKETIEASIRSGEAKQYSPKQQAFMHYNLFYLLIEEPTPSGESLNACLIAMAELDPENMAVPLLRYLTEKKYGSANTAAEILAEMKQRGYQPTACSGVVQPKLLRMLDYQDSLNELRAIE